MYSPKSQMHLIILYSCSETLEEDLFYFTPFRLVHEIFIDLKLKTVPEWIWLYCYNVSQLSKMKTICKS